MPENNQPEETEDEYFERTGMFRMKLPIKIKITEYDMVRDLVKKTEGKMIKPDGIDDITKN